MKFLHKMLHFRGKFENVLCACTRHLVIKHIQILFFWKWNLKRKNFILYILLIFASRITSSRLFSPVQFEINHVQIYLTTKLGFLKNYASDKKVCFYIFLTFFLYGMTSCPLIYSPPSVTICADTLKYIQKKCLAPIAEDHPNTKFNTLLNP